MMTFLIILSALLWIASFAALPKKILLSPALSFLAMVTITFARMDGFPVVPLTQGMIISWLSITLVVMLTVILQNAAIRQQSRGLGYMTLGALAGMAIGLLAYSFSSSLQLLYALSIIGAAIGISLGFLIFTNTPDGRAVAPGSGNFFRYLLAKGFPTLVTTAQLAVVLVVIIIGYAPL